MNTIHLSGLQPVWEKSIINEAETNAIFEMGFPNKRETVMVADKPWEHKCMHYHCVVRGKDKYQMYYCTHYITESIEKPTGEVVSVFNSCVAYAESDDGLNWEKPILRMCEVDGSLENNIILRSQDKKDDGDFFDNFFVFIDKNPKCPSEKKYKALAYANLYRLSTYVSADGIHWSLEGILDMDGHFDSFNICFWDEKINKYVAYIRSFHNIPEGDLNAGIRDARRTESEDFINWTTPQLIQFIDTEDYPIYTNGIMKYYRNPDILIGFPTRYMEHPQWTSNFDELCGKERRLRVMQQEKRYGLTVTDGIFMAGRDGVNFYKYDEALFPPGPEFVSNWMYGNGYMAYHMLETPADDGENSEISLFLEQNYNHCDPESAPDIMVRHTLRRDGFACYRGTYKGNVLKTAPFTFDGSDLFINFSTSARGYIVITITSEDGKSAKTCRLFGDHDQRRIHFEGADLNEFSGKKVTLFFEMFDARLYAFEIR